MTQREGNPYKKKRGVKAVSKSRFKVIELGGFFVAVKVGINICVPPVNRYAQLFGHRNSLSLFGEPT